MSVLEALSIAPEACVACGTEIYPKSQEKIFDTRFGVDAYYVISRCPNCQLVQTLPKPSPQELKRLYESYYNFGGEKGTRYTHARQRFLLSPLYRAWLLCDGDISFHGCRGHGRLLDVGCNEGRGLQIYKSNGYSAEGLEFNKEAAKAAQSLGFKVYSEELSTLKLGKPYDVVILSNVLEHALDPGAMVEDIHKILAPKGQLWISCPNSKSWLRNLFGRFWINWHVPFHIVHFSIDTLAALVQKHGYTVLQVRNETPALWFTQSLIARFFAKPGRPTRQLRSVLYVLPIMTLARVLLFPFFWLANRTNHGDCLVMVVEKKEYNSASFMEGTR